MQLPYDIIDSIIGANSKMGLLRFLRLLRLLRLIKMLKINSLMASAEIKWNVDLRQLRLVFLVVQVLLPTFPTLHPTCCPPFAPTLPVPSLPPLSPVPSLPPLSSFPPLPAPSRTNNARLSLGAPSRMRSSPSPHTPDVRAGLLPFARARLRLVLCGRRNGRVQGPVERLRHVGQHVQRWAPSAWQLPLMNLVASDGEPRRRSLDVCSTSAASPIPPIGRMSMHCASVEYCKPPGVPMPFATRRLSHQYVASRRRRRGR